MTVDAARLWQIQALVDRRRREVTGPLGRLAHPLLRGAVGGVLGAGVIAAVLRASGPEEARLWWVLATLVSAVLVVLGGPFRMFWRFDSTLLARLPIAGRVLYHVATRRSMVTAAGSLVALTVGLVPLGIAVGGMPAFRLFFLAVALLVAAGILAPIAATAAGSIVVSAKTQALIHELSSGQAAQGTVWLSIVPAMSGMGLGFIGWFAAQQPAGGRELLGLVLAVCALLHTVGRKLADVALAAATREVAALDAVKLAHVDLVGPRALERLWGRLTAGAGRALYEKDVTVLRRRHPGYYLLTGLGILTLWIVAFAAAEPARTHVTLAGTGALAAYIVLLARRLTVPPAEQPRLLGTLPTPPSTIARAKIVHVVWRALWLAVVGGTPAVLRSPRPLLVAGGVAGIAVVSAILAALVVRARD